MTALTQYSRLEASGLWLPEGETQRREVIVSLGEATLMIADMQDRPLTHWSLPAIERTNAMSDARAVYRPASDASERLEIVDDDMISAIAKIQKAVDRGRTRPGRLRTAIIGSVVIAAVTLTAIWLPGALTKQAITIVPKVTRAEIGNALLERIRRLSGQPCDTAQGSRALQTLRQRLMPSGGRIVIVESGVDESLHLPGRIVVVGRDLVEDYDQPEVLAGYVLTELERAAKTDPLEDLLRYAGLGATLRLLTQGEVSDETLDAYAEHIVVTPPSPVDTDALAQRFAEAGISATPFAYAEDITGATTLPLIEAASVSTFEPQTVLDDSDWVALQGICEE